MGTRALCEEAPESNPVCIITRLRKKCEKQRYLAQRRTSGNESFQRGGETGSQRHAGGHGHPSRMPLYSVPRPIYTWEDTERQERHVSWGDLFYDLTFVGVVFNSGHLLALEISGLTIWLFLATLLLMYSSWTARLQETAILHAEDYTHKFIHALQAITVALAAANISSFGSLSTYSNGTALVFTYCMILNQVLHAIPWMELFFFPGKSKIARRVALRHVGLAMFVRIVMLLLSLIFIYAEIALQYTTIFWFLGWLIPRMISIAWIWTGLETRSNTFPVDVMYVHNRLAHYSMYMLGEGVLQLVIFNLSAVDSGAAHRLLAPSGEKSAISYHEYVLQVVLAFLLLALLQLLHYSSLPWNVEDHPFRKSRYSGVLWFETLSLYFVTQVCIGVGIKLFLKLEGGVKAKYYWFFQISMCTCLLFRWVQQYLNSQWSKLERDMSLRVIVFQTVFPLAFLALGPVTLAPLYLLLFNVLLLLVLFVWQVFHGKFRRKRKWNRVALLIIFIGRLKLRVKGFRRRRQVHSSEVEGSSKRESSAGVVHQRKKSFAWKPVAVASSALRFWREGIRSSNTYSKPMIRQDWESIHDNDDSQMEVDWADLFFDLIYVGICFRINLLFGYGWRSFWIQAALVIILFVVWTDKLIIQARFVTPDTFHKVLEIFHGCAVALLASSINPTWVTGSPFVPSLYTFAAAYLLTIAWEMGIYLEVFFSYPKNACEHANPRSQAKISMASLLCKCLCGIVALALVAVEAPIEFLALAWVLGAFSGRVLLFLMYAFKVFSSKDIVPVDIHYVLHRTSEIGLIFIGEGVLSLISLPVVVSAPFLSTWCLGFFVFVLLRQLFFFVEHLHDPAQTAMRRSAPRSLVHSMIVPLYMLGFCLIGGEGLTTMVEQLETDATFLLGTYSYCLLGFLFIADMLHEADEFPRFLRSSKARKGFYLLALCLKAYTIAQFAIIAQLRGWASYSILLAELFTLSLMLAGHALHLHIRRGMQPPQAELGGAEGSMRPSTLGGGDGGTAAENDIELQVF